VKAFFQTFLETNAVIFDIKVYILNPGNNIFADLLII